MNNEITSYSYFGICTIGKYLGFYQENIDSSTKVIINVESTFEELLTNLRTIRHIFIVSKFESIEQIEIAIQLLQICKHERIFCTAIVPESITNNSSINKIMSLTDIFLRAQNCYCENVIYEDPVSYAITYLMEFLDYIDEEDIYVGNCPIYYLLNSGTAQIINFELCKDNYENQEICIIPENVKEIINGKRIGLILAESGIDKRIWPAYSIETAVKIASQKMIYSCMRIVFNPNIAKKTFVSLFLSDLDNQNNNIIRK